MVSLDSATIFWGKVGLFLGGGGIMRTLKPAVSTPLSTHITLKRLSENISWFVHFLVFPSAFFAVLIRARVSARVRARVRACQCSIDELSTMLNGAVLAAETAGPNLRVRDNRRREDVPSETGRQRRKAGRRRGRQDARSTRRPAFRTPASLPD